MTGAEIILYITDSVDKKKIKMAQKYDKIMIWFDLFTQEIDNKINIEQARYIFVEAHFERIQSIDVCILIITIYFRVRAPLRACGGF